MAISSLPTYKQQTIHEEEYLPESDGKPMAETEVHRDQLIDILFMLKQHFRKNRRICITGNIFLYYLGEMGARKSVSPDIFVTRGIEKKQRRIYKLEDEGKGPDFVIELTSRSTKKEDLVDKKQVYQELGVREYFLYDPLEEYLPNPLLGYRLEADNYVPFDGKRLHSKVLGLDLVVEKKRLRFYDPKTGKRLISQEEIAAENRAQRAARRAEKKARQAAEAEVARLREELARLRGDKKQVTPGR